MLGKRVCVCICYDVNSIQVDAFEVQLGAGVLLQFRVGARVVTVLADAGVHASGYPEDHVLNKLPDALDAFEEGNRRIDLIVATHYDADHIKGLAPIIRDGSFEIGEIWLPPVTDDQTAFPLGMPLSENQFLGHAWLAEGGEAKARRYLDAALAQCEVLRGLETEALPFANEQRGLSWDVSGRREGMERAAASFGPHDGTWRGIRERFRADLDECKGLDGEDECGCHADEVFDDPAETDPGNPSAAGRSLFPGILRSTLDFEARSQIWQSNPVVAANHSRSFAHLRRTTASGAITASHLAEVIAAIKERAPRIPVMFRTITDGEPDRFRWNGRSRRFLPAATGTRALPTITLMGPSKGLVEKHRDKLPVLHQARLALLSEIPIMDITPSNQLSYIFKIEHEGQSLLISGDAGCVDFKTSPRGNYHEKLLDELGTLHVVQIAHHAGNNAHFYRVLLAAELAAGEVPPYMILSHATDDKHRPSEAFARFVDHFPKEVDPYLLFTSRPKAKRAQGLEDLVHATVGGEADVGDVRLVHDGARWNVDLHAVSV